jgi:hypothetical protein
MDLKRGRAIGIIHSATRKTNVKENQHITNGWKKIQKGTHCFSVFSVWNILEPLQRRDTLL